MSLFGAGGFLAVVFAFAFACGMHAIPSLSRSTVHNASGPLHCTLLLTFTHTRLEHGDEVARQVRPAVELVVLCGRMMSRPRMPCQDPLFLRVHETNKIPGRGVAHHAHVEDERDESVVGGGAHVGVGGGHQVREPLCGFVCENGMMGSWIGGHRWPAALHIAIRAGRPKSTHTDGPSWACCCAASPSSSCPAAPAWPRCLCVVQGKVWGQ